MIATVQDLIDALVDLPRSATVVVLNAGLYPGAGCDQIHNVQLVEAGPNESEVRLDPCPPDRFNRED